MEKKNESINKNANRTSVLRFYFGSIFLLNLVAIILLLTTDFGGWYIYNPGYQNYDEEGYIWIGSQKAFPFAQIFLLILIVGLAYSGYISAVGLNNQTKMTFSLIKRGMFISFGVVLFSLLGVILMAIIFAGATSWWVDTSFYASLIGGGVSSLLFKLMMSSFS